MLANHKSAEKRARQNMKRRLRNKSVKTRIKHVTKDVHLAAGNKSVKTRIKHVTKDVHLAAGEASKEAAFSKLAAAQSAIDKAAKKGVIHKRTAARKISRLTRLTAHKAPD